MAKKKSFILDKYFYISKAALHSSIRTIFLILFGSAVIFPVVYKLPLLGWDWYYFFNANNPIFNIFSSNSAYPPFARYIIWLFTWMDWRTSLAILNSITIMTIAIATWKNGGKYVELMLALCTPPLWFLMWVGHPDGLVLLGLITGIIPLVLMKPILSFFAIFSNRKLFAWTMMFLIISLLIWPGWMFLFRWATFGHEAAFGWADMGWPLLLIGLVLFLGAGKDPYRLMAAGCFITPYLMPYHMVLLTPAFGKTHGWRGLLLWISSWFVYWGTAMSGSGHLFSFIFPLSVYCLSGSFIQYCRNIKNVLYYIKNSMIELQVILQK